MLHVSPDSVTAMVLLGRKPGFQNAVTAGWPSRASVSSAQRPSKNAASSSLCAMNDRARRLYESCGFQIEGVLRDEFHLGGQYVDDVLMARFLIVG